jgi:hypothetical protein
MSANSIFPDSKLVVSCALRLDYMVVDPNSLQRQSLELGSVVAVSILPSCTGSGHSDRCQFRLPFT